MTRPANETAATTRQPAAFAIKVALADPDAAGHEFAAQKTMYGGKRIAPGDTIFLFASETAGGTGLVARGVVSAVRHLPRIPTLARQTPRLDLAIRRVAGVRAPLGRRDLKPFSDWGDGRPETELNFKLYRQATDKVIGLTDAAAQFLARRF
ncbi:hypothetical protein [Ancylobacter terrae]|uniref:hypothetical protein n=1 Tax=Ancylobacter sp. sgz301288 TaxID=3342077 RepID=UPI003858943E